MTAETALRDTFAVQTDIIYRSRAVQSLLNVTVNTLRSYGESCGFHIPRAGTVPARLFDIPTVFRLADWRRTAGYTKSLPGDRPVFLTTAVNKGGTAKSTTTAEMGVQLQLMGLRVLMIDLDVQGSLTHLLGYESDLEVSECAAYGLTPKAIVTDTFANLLEPYLTKKRRDRTTEWPDPQAYIKRPFGPYGPALIPADPFLDDVVISLINTPGSRELNIKNLFDASLRGEIEGFDLREFDVVIFDCPPALSLLNTNALAASDLAISPIRMDAFSVKGLKRMIGEINMLTTSYGIQPKLAILPTYHAPNLKRMGRMLEQLKVYEDYQAPVTISQSELFPNSVEQYLPLTLQNPTCAPVLEYRKFSEYIYSRIFEIQKERTK